MKVELEKRLIAFSVDIIDLSKLLEYNVAARNLSFQIVKSSTSSALNYGEAQSAESRKDFVHKISIVVKELKETQINLEIIKRAHLSKAYNKQEKLMRECQELIAIFTKTIQTAKKNMLETKK